MQGDEFCINRGTLCRATSPVQTGERYAGRRVLYKQGNVTQGDESCINKGTIYRAKSPA
jgi:hypothetical protein